MKTIDKYKGNPFHNRDILYLAEDPNFKGLFAAKAFKAEERAFKSNMEARIAECELDRIHNEVRDALSKGNFRGVPLRDKDFDYPIVDPIRWANITLKRFRAKEIPEHHGAEMYHMEMLISQAQLETLNGEQIRSIVINKFTSLFQGHITKLMGRGGK